MEKKHLEEQKAKEAQSEKKPAWQLFYGMRDDCDAFMTKQHWIKTIEAGLESMAGDEEDRWV